MKTVWSAIAALVLFTATAFPAGRIFDTNVVVETFAGSGFSGNLDGIGLETMFESPGALCLDGQENLFGVDHSERGRWAIRKISPLRVVTTVWKSEEFSSYEIFDLGIAGGRLCFSSRDQLFRLQNGVPEVFAGVEGGFGVNYEDGPALSARFKTYIVFDVAPNGEFFLADGNRRIRKMDVNGIVSTIAGSGNIGQQDGTGVFCSFRDIRAITVASSGDLFIIDRDMIRRVSQSFKVTTVAGGASAGHEDGPGAEARFNTPYGIAVDAGGSIYVADSGNNAVRKIRPDGFVVTLVEDLIRGSKDLKVATDGSLFIADTSNNLIRKMSFAPSAPQELSANLYAGITINGKVGQMARIEYTEAVGVGWKPLTTVTLDKTPFLWFDSDSPNHSKRFYRSVILP